jgi:hypothetical protein
LTHMALMLSQQREKTQISPRVLRLAAGYLEWQHICIRDGCTVRKPSR